MKPDQLSQTAAFIAIKLYGLTQTEPYQSLFDQETIDFYDRMVKELPSPLRWYHRVLKKSWIRKLFIFSEELLLPGDLMHIVARKWQIERFLEQFLNQGFKQILVLGSGFDHLAAKYSNKGTKSFEIDAPGMIQRKKGFLDQYGYSNDKLYCFSIHIDENHPGIGLSDIPALDPNEKTVIIAEGFFDYLTPRQTDNQLEEFSTYFKDSVSLISTVFSLDELPVFRRWVFKSSVWMVGERLKLDINLQEYSSILASHGFEMSGHLSTQNLNQLLFEEVGERSLVLPGFHLLIAEKK